MNKNIQLFKSEFPASINPLCAEFLKGMQICICISYHFSTLKQYRELKSFLVEDREQLILPVNTMAANDLVIQVISSHGIDLVLLKFNTTQIFCDNKMRVSLVIWFLVHHFMSLFILATNFWMAAFIFIHLPIWCIDMSLMWITHCVLVMSYGILNLSLINIALCDGLLPGNTKPLPEPMLMSHQWGPVAFTWGQFHRKYKRYQLLGFAWKLYIWYHYRIVKGQWVD